MGVIHDVQMDYYGRRAAVASDDHKVYVTDLGDGQNARAAELKSHEGPVWKVAWAHPKFGSPNRSSILASCGYDMKVIIWKEVAPAQWQIAYLDTSHTASVNDVQFCDWVHGLRLACASSDGTVSVLSHSVQDQQWHRAAFQAHAGGTQTLSWAPVASREQKDAQAPMRLVTGGCDNDVKLWRLEGEAWSQEFPPLPATHTDWVRVVAWRPDDVSMIASGAWDKSVAIWKQDMEGQPWRQAALLKIADRVENISWTSSGGILAVACADGGTSLYREGENGEYTEVSKVGEAGIDEKYRVAPPEPAAEAHNGVQLVTLVPGDGRTFPKTGDMLSVHYTGKIAATGVKFDSSFDRGVPFRFQVGLGNVIEGWDKGAMQMSLGQKCVMTISSELGYGEEGAGGVIPPNADLLFEVELLQIG